MTRYDPGMKVAISLPDEVLARLDAAASASGQNRSEFFRAAGLRYAIEIEAGGLTHQINEHLDHLGPGVDAESIAVVGYGHEFLARSTAGDEW